LGRYKANIDGLACNAPETGAKDAAFTDDEINLRMAVIRARW
jgi:hypothetical protein